MSYQNFSRKKNLPTVPISADHGYFYYDLLKGQFVTE